MEAKTQKSGTKKARNRRKNSFSRPKAISKIILIALAALSLVAAVLYIFLGKPGKDEMEQVIDDGTILQGITVNGVDVAGMNYKQARDAVLPSVEEDLRSIHITVSHSTNMWLLTAADIRPSSTLDAAITEALTLGRGGTVIENAKDKEDIAQTGGISPLLSCRMKPRLRFALRKSAACSIPNPLSRMRLPYHPQRSRSSSSMKAWTAICSMKMRCIKT